MTAAAPGLDLAFPRVLLVHTAPSPDLDLLDCAASLGGQAVVAAYPSVEVLDSLAPAARSSFERRGLAPPGLRLLPEMDVDAALEAASASRADLLVMRHPRSFDKPRALARRVLAESGCSVCFVPEGPAPRFERILAGVSLDESGRELLGRAASLCRAAGAAELVAVHSCFHDSFSGCEECREEFVSERTLALFRFMARSRLSGVPCVPLIEEAAEPHRAIARAAAGRSADLVVVGRRRGGSIRTSLAPGAPARSRRRNPLHAAQDLFEPRAEIQLDENPANSGISSRIFKPPPDLDRSAFGGPPAGRQPATAKAGRSCGPGYPVPLRAGLRRARMIPLDRVPLAVTGPAERRATPEYAGPGSRGKKPDMVEDRVHPWPPHDSRLERHSAVAPAPHLTGAPRRKA
jgi:nucleotide-binding universal stress UspA family protein